MKRGVFDIVTELGGFVTSVEYLVGFEYTSDQGSLFAHDFREAILDAAGFVDTNKLLFVVFVEWQAR